MEDEKKLELTAEEKEKLEKQKQLEDTNKALTAELIETRKKKQEAEAKVTELAAQKPQLDQDEEKLQRIVEATLAKKDAEQAAKNLETAFEQFKSEHKEFAPDNDPGEIKLNALRSKFKMFNTSNLKEARDFYAVIADSYRLLGGTDTTPSDKTMANPYSITPTTKPTPSVSTDNGLSPQEKKVIQDLGWTEDRFKKLKTKHPSKVSQLLAGNKDVV